MSVRAKFSVTTLVSEEGPYKGYVELWMEAITGPDGKELQLSNHGRLEMQVLNEQEFKQFELGKTCWLTFEREGEHVNPADLYFG